MLVSFLLITIVGIIESTKSAISMYIPQQSTKSDNSSLRFKMEESRNALYEIIRAKPSNRTGPFFDMGEKDSEIVGLVGETLLLRCRVGNLDNRTVSWVRHRDVHLLTVGRYTYTSDQRFEAVHPPHTGEWNLRIKYPQRKDSGIYECQISTTPPSSFLISVTIKETITQIVGAPDLFIDVGSTINLTCLIEFTPDPPPDIQWKHGEQEIDFDSPRGGISLVTVQAVPNSSSRLLILNAGSPDSGEYVCAPSNAKPSTIRVHILKGEHPAAMYHGGSGTVLICSSLMAAVVVLPKLFLLPRFD